MTAGDSKHSYQRGSIRAAQLLHHFGPGAIVDLPDGSFITNAVDQWKFKYGQIREEDHDAVMSAFNQKPIRLLNSNPEAIRTKVSRFPIWRFCPNCGSMTDQPRRTFCTNPKCEPLGVKYAPMRFVTVCRKGHISDFPWVKWAHQEHDVCDKPRLRLMTDKGTLSSSYKTMRIICSNCEAPPVSLARIKEKGELERVTGKKCAGTKPWILHHQAETCDAEMTVALRGETKLHIPNIQSVITLPLKTASSEAIYQEIDKKYELFKNTWSNFSSEQKMVMLKGLLSDGDWTENDIQKGVHYLDSNRQLDDISFGSIKQRELSAWKHTKTAPLQEKDCQAERVPVPEDWTDYISHITRVDLMREVRALTSFNRLKYADSFVERKAGDGVSIFKNHTNWYPGIEIFGEGIFIELNPEMIEEWESRDSVKRIFESQLARFQQKRLKRDQAEIELYPRHILLHTFAHALIRAFAETSGYSSTSLRERLYFENGAASVLIHTAEGDSESSLGGLIELAKPEKMSLMLKRAIELTEYCSSDPTCLEGGQDRKAAACHCCLFLSETSCEWNNELLDRRTLHPKLSDDHLAFFDL